MEIHAVSFADLAREKKEIAAMRDIFASYTPVPWRESEKYSARFYLDLLRNQLSPLPYFVAKCCRRDFAEAMKAVFLRHGADLLLCDFLQTAAPALELSIPRRVVFQHNVEYLLRRRQCDAESSPVKKWLFGREWKKTRRIEERVCRAFDHVIAVSDEDREVFEKEFGVKSVSTIATGVDSDYFQPQAIPVQPGRLAFVGSMDWYPNEDGVIWFLNEVYPLIRKQAANVSFKIIGRNPSAHLSAAVARLPEVELTGRVEDVRPFLAEAEVIVVPLRAGGGTRIKIPEAMAMGKAVVSTSVGAEGLPFTDGQEIRIADAPQDFAQAVTQLLSHSGLRIQIENAARERVRRDHGWDAVVDELEEVLMTLEGREKLYHLPLEQTLDLVE
jgi:glycosyltransferase involved in cell wall biosynthesis